MASSTLICVCYYVLIIIFHLQTSKGEQICKTLSCGDIDIAFPFSLIEANQAPRCSYFPNPSFQLSCNNQSQTILNLPETDNLIIKNINYTTQTIKVNDPKGCLPKRYLDNNFNFSDSPFKLNPEIYNLDFIFLRCPSNVTTDFSSSSFQFPLTSISCLSNNEKHSNLSSSSVIFLLEPPYVNITLFEMCEVISTTSVPIPWKDLNISSNQGLSRSAKFGLAIGVGIPAFVCLIGFACFCCGKKGTTPLDGQRTSSNVPTLTISLAPLPSFVTGLDGATIEKYPKTLLGESGRLLKPNDNTCSICLSEYQPKDTLRSIPECNHYFHVACIDEWLKMNGTCPICRNSPEAYSSTGPYFASLLLSPNSSSLSTSR
ncbi:unnamed protein product [Trifolium pratense]|uniref:Uncharacterized protein n=1 Tax=Trifolium pratense TaxID=57577 RepID=A0ACB0M6V2_TRIPR|nr:unnamed protein product [Trifolium pratense]